MMILSTLQKNSIDTIINIRTLVWFSKNYICMKYRSFKREFPNAISKCIIVNTLFEEKYKMQV